jgi:hypothetical protein
VPARRLSPGNNITDLLVLVEKEADVIGHLRCVSKLQETEGTRRQHLLTDKKHADVLASRELLESLLDLSLGGLLAASVRT